MKYNISGKPTKQCFILLYTQNEYEVINFTTSYTCEDICRILCEKYGLKPLSKLLFSLRRMNSGSFLPPGYPLELNERFEFRMRFKLSDLSTIKSLDRAAFDYLFHQSKHDFVKAMIPGLEYPNHKNKVVGLGATAMLVDILENKISATDCEKDFKSYFPSKYSQKHRWFLGSAVSVELNKFKQVNCDVNFVKKLFIETIMSLAPNFLLESYAANALYFDEASKKTTMERAEIKFTPFDREHPGLHIYYTEKKKSKHIARPQDIYAIINEHDIAKLEVYDYSIGFSVQIDDPRKMQSFVSYLAGYYRLLVKWSIDICLNLQTPSLKRLQEIGCHGPIGGEYSYNKLQEKQCIPGTYIIRQCDKVYDDHYVDIVINGNIIKTYRVTHQCDKWQLYLPHSTTNTFSTLKELVTSIDVNCKFQLFPSEHDKSPLLLLCLPTDQITAKQNLSVYNESELRLNKPQIFHPAKDLRVYINSKRTIEKGAMIEMRADWLLPNNAKQEVTVRTLKVEKYFAEFMQLTDKWSQLNSPALVKMYGFSTTSPYSYITESIKRGPLTEFLQSAKNSTVSDGCLINAAYTLARALHYLQEQNIVHGRIRCESLYVIDFESPDSLVVRLGDPGFQKSYICSALPWIPPEYHGSPESARTDFNAEIWAYATTIWEIFSFGEKPLLQYFLTGKRRLSEPENCPREIYKIMQDGWNIDPMKRPSLQDIFTKLAVARGAKKRVFSKISNILTEQDHITEETNNTNVCNDQSFLMKSAYMGETILSNTSNSKSYCESAFEDNYGNNVIVQDQIGFGNYGCVFRGLYEQPNSVKEVAIKRLRDKPKSEDLNDFQREISIMQSLNHPNIVKIITWIEQPDLSIVMEYVKHCSFLMYLNSNPTLTTCNLLKFAKDIANGMEYLAGKNVVHRDLAARNILVDIDECLKISDFGLAQFADSNGYYVTQHNRSIPIKWYALESLRHNKYSHYTDVWSYGITLFEIFSRGQEPNLIPNETLGIIELCEALESGKRLQKPDLCTQQIYDDLLTRCWDEKPKDRPNFTTILEIINDFVVAYNCSNDK